MCKKEIFIALVWIGILSGCSDNQGSKKEEHPPVTVNLMILKVQNVELPIELTALTVASHPVQIRARVEGFLQTQNYREGSFVRAGQTLFTMDQKPFNLAVVSAAAALGGEVAKKENTMQNLERVRNMYAQKASSQQDLEAAITADKTQESSLNQAKVSLDGAKLNLSYTTIAAPISGWVDKVTQYEGSYIVPSQNGLLTTLYQTDPLYVDFSIKSEMMEKLKNQNEKELSIDVILSDGTLFPNRGKISFFSPVVDSVTGTRMVRAEVSNSKGLLTPGEFVKVRIRGVQKDALVIPSKALMQGEKGTFVYVVDEDKIAQFRPVKVGEWIADNIVISEGLKDGEKIVCEGNARVDAGKVVKIVSFKNEK
ncbi:MAG: efflux RND transporter periplasmic adaptor subunit [Campylobacterales bacterium]|nr:efflux RND transporter periplasmic adaptor subunit [Campylobacterales bacterium]